VPAIIYAEDSEDDFFFFSRSAKATPLAPSLIWVRNGVHAQQVLESAQAHPPRAIVTDLKMPRMDGFDLIKWIRTQPQLDHVPLFVLSSSFLPDDIERCKKLGITRYFVKPVGPEYRQIIDSIVAELGLSPARENTATAV
jgi:CheY-like chemotaxis protein